MTVTLGTCTLQSTPVDMGNQMIQRRIQGKSWGEIADEFGLPNPGAARTKFTKLTGITDYKIKGKELKHLVDNNLLSDIKGSAKKVAKKAVDKADNAVSSTHAFDKLMNISDKADTVVDFQLKHGVSDGQLESFANYMSKHAAYAKKGLMTEAEMDDSFGHAAKFYMKMTKIDDDELKALYDAYAKLNNFTPNPFGGPKLTDYETLFNNWGPVSNSTASDIFDQVTISKGFSPTEVKKEMTYLKKLVDTESPDAIDFWKLDHVKKWDISQADINKLYQYQFGSLPPPPTLAKGVQEGVKDAAELIEDHIINKTGFSQEKIDKALDAYQNQVKAHASQGTLDNFKSVYKEAFDVNDDEWDILLQNKFGATDSKVTNPLQKALEQEKVKLSAEAKKQVMEGAEKYSHSAVGNSESQIVELQAKLDAKVANVWDAYKGGNVSYESLGAKFGVSIPDVDSIVWHNTLIEKGDLWKAYVSKPTSQTGFESVKKMIYDLRADGLTAEELADVTGIDKKVIDLVVQDKWSMPPAKSVDYMKIAKTSSYGGYGGNPVQSVPNQVFFETPEHTGFNFQTEQEWIDWNNSSPQLSSEELRAFKTYTGNGYGQINAGLRNGGNVTQTSKHLSNGMHPIPKDARVVRYVGGNTFNDVGGVQDLGGKVWSDKGFMSTAVHQHGTFSSYPIRIEIDVSAGTKGRYVDTFSSHRGEKELILDRDIPMLVTHVEKTSYGWLVKMKALS